MKFSENLGIEIDEIVKNLIEKAIKREGSQNRFAIAIGVPAQNVQNWRGTGKRIGEYIVWEQWERIKPYFIRNGDISADDVRWMIPSEMRGRLLSAIKSGAILAKDERLLVENYRLADESGRKAILATAQTLAAVAKRDSSKSGEMAK